MTVRPVLVVVASLAPGGMERVAALVAGGLARCRLPVRFLTFEPAPVDHYRLDPGVDRVRLEYYWDTAGLVDRFRSALARWKRLRRALLDASPSCIIAFGDTTNLRVLLSSLGTGLPVVVSERSDPRQYAIPAAWQWLRRRLYPRAAAVVVQTQSVAQWASEFIDPARVHVIPNPVRPVPPAGPRPALLPNSRVVLGVGRLSHEKGFDLLLRAFAAAGLARLGWSLVVLGEGPDRGALLDLARSLDLAIALHLPGIVDNPEAFMQHADLFVLPSRYEGFPNALLEAMACGTACIAFDCPSGPADIIRHEHTGLLVAPGDPEALRNAILAVAADPSRRTKLALAAAADVSARFRSSVVAAKWLALFGAPPRSSNEDPAP